MASSRPGDEGRVHLLAEDYLSPHIDREKLVNSIQVHRLQIEALRQRIKGEKDEARRAGSRQQESTAPPGRKTQDVLRSSSERRTEWWTRSTESRINTVQEDECSSNPSTITLFDGPSDKFILDGSRLSVEELAPFLEDQKIFTDSNSDDAGHIEQKFSIVDRAESTGSGRKILSIKKARRTDSRESSRTVPSPAKSTTDSAKSTTKSAKSIPNSHQPAMGENDNPNSARTRSWLEAQLVPADRAVLQEAINACVDTRRVLIAWRVAARNLRERTVLEDHILRQRRSELSCVILLRSMSHWRRCAAQAKLQRVKDGMWESALSRVIRRWNKSHKKVDFKNFCRGIIIERQRRLIVEKANSLLKRHNRNVISDVWDSFVFACHHNSAHFSAYGVRSSLEGRKGNLKLTALAGITSSSFRSQLEIAAADHHHKRVAVRAWELWRASTCLHRISLHCSTLSASRLLSRSFSAWRARNRLWGSVATLIVHKSEKSAAVVGIRVVMMWRLVTETRRGKRILQGVADGFAKRSLCARSLSAMRWRARLAKYAGLMASSSSGRVRAGKTGAMHSSIRGRVLATCRAWFQRWLELVHVQRMQQRSEAASSRQRSRQEARLLARALVQWHGQASAARSQKLGESAKTILAERFESLQSHASATQGMWLFKANWRLRQRQHKAAWSSRKRVYTRWLREGFTAWRFALFSQMRGLHEKNVRQAALKQAAKTKKAVFEAVKTVTSRARSLHNRALKVWRTRWRKVFVGWREVGRKRAQLQRIAATSLAFVVKVNCMGSGLRRLARAVRQSKENARVAECKYQDRVRRLLSLWAQGAAQNRAYNAKVGRAIGVWKGKILKMLSQCDFSYSHSGADRISTKAFAKLYRHQNVSFQQRMKKKVFMVCQLYYGRLRAGFDVWVDVWGYRRQHRMAAIRKVQRMACEHAITSTFEAFVFCRMYRTRVREALRKASSLTASKRVLLSRALRVLRQYARCKASNRTVLLRHARRCNYKLATLMLISWKEAVLGAQTTLRRETLLAKCAALSVRRQRHRTMAKHLGRLASSALVRKRCRAAVDKGRLRRACSLLNDWNRAAALACLSRLRAASEAMACYLSNFRQRVFSDMYDVVQARLRKRRLARKVRRRHLRVWLDRWVRVLRLGCRTKQSERRVGRAQERRRLEDTALVFECLVEEVWRRTEREKRRKMFVVVHRYCLQLRKHLAIWWEWTVRTEWVRTQGRQRALNWRHFRYKMRGFGAFRLHARLSVQGRRRAAALLHANVCRRARDCVLAWRIVTHGAASIGREEEVRESAGRYFRRRATKFLMLRILLGWISALGSPDQARHSGVEEEEEEAAEERGADRAREEEGGGEEGGGWRVAEVDEEERETGKRAARRREEGPEDSDDSDEAEAGLV